MKKLLYNSSFKNISIKLFFTMVLLTSVFANAQEEDTNNASFTQTIFGDDLTSSTDFGNKLEITNNFGASLFTAVDPTPFDPTVNDVPGAPVDDWALPFTLLSLISAYFYFRKKRTIFNS